MSSWTKKISTEEISKVSDETDLKQYFGNWFSEPSKVEEIKNSYISSSDKIKHVVIDNFLNPEVALEMSRSFPSPSKKDYHLYFNPIEMKFAMDNLNEMAPVSSLFFKVLSSPEVLKTMSQITGIEDLEFDPYLHGAGLHAHPRGGVLLPHLDYSIHPASGKERRINIIFYLNENWNNTYNGQTTLFHEDMKVMNQVFPSFNRALIFQTFDLSWHGVVPQISCPENEFRKSAAIYYVSDPRAGATLRTKAQFTYMPGQKRSAGMDELLRLRCLRRIEKEDVEKNYPNWTDDLVIPPDESFFSED